MSYFSNVTNLVSGYISPASTPNPHEELDVAFHLDNELPEFSKLFHTDEWLKDKKLVRKIVDKGAPLLIKGHSQADIVSDVYRKIVMSTKLDLPRLLVLMLQAQKSNQISLFESCLARFPEVHVLEDEEGNPGKMQLRYIMTLLARSSIDISVSVKGMLKIALPYSTPKEVWDLIIRFHHQLIPITHIELKGELRGESEFSNLLPFFEKNKKIISLELGACPFVGDNELEKLAVFLEKIEGFRIRGARITHIPKLMNFYLKEIDCRECFELTTRFCEEFPDILTLSRSGMETVDSYVKKKMYSYNNESLESITLHKSLYVEIQDCPKLMCVYGERVEEFICEGCDSVQTLYLPSVKKMSTDLNRFPKLKEITLAENIVRKIILPHPEVRVRSARQAPNGNFEYTEISRSSLESCVIS